VQSVAEASFDSWIHYGTRTPDDVNSTVDFYGKGALVSLLIDLEMRKRSGGRASLDDVMRALFERFPLAAGKGYTTDDLLAIIEELTEAQFDDIFERYVRDAQPLEFEEVFKAVGLELTFRPGDAAGAGADAASRRGRARADGETREPAREGEATAPDDDGAATSPPEAQSQTQPETQPESQPASQPQPPKLKAHLGLNLSDGGTVAPPVGSASSAATAPPTAAGRTTVTSVLSDGPAFAAGILAGDEIIALDGRRLTAASLDARLRAYKPGETITLTCFRRDQMRTVEITLTGKPDGRWTLRKMRNASDEQKAAYESWLGQKW
jgi:predicted metalloprotease with PDZ domain